MFTRDNIKLIVVAAVVAVIGLSAPAIGHGVHARFAHNADRVDGLHATQIPVSGRQVVTASSASNPNDVKSATATCPVGKFVVGSGFDLIGGASGGPVQPELTHVVVRRLIISTTSVHVSAWEVEPHNNDWHALATAICAKAP